MDDSDVEELFYTPLKRKKLGHESFQNSQVTYSSVRSQICSKNSSQKPSQKKMNLSQISNKSKLKKNNKTPVSFKKPLNILLNKSNATQNGRLTTSTKTRTIGKKFNKIEHEESLKIECEESLDIQLLNNKNNNNNNNNNAIDDDIPDIDFTQKFDTFSSDISDNKLQSSSDILVEEENFETKKNLFDEELVVQTDIDKVDSWLVKSVQDDLIIPQKTEIANWVCDDKQKENRNLDLRTTENSPKTCVHLHFHVNSPKKFFQPTIDHFFTKSSAGCVNNFTPESKLKKLDSNSEEVLKSWKNIMKSSVRDKAGPSGISQNYGNFEKEKEVISKKQKYPFYKRVEDTTFVVDGFNYGYIDGVSSYFLSHFHYDHYIGLNKRFKKRIYCSKITANLLRLKLNVEDRFINPLPLEEPRVIDGVEVTLYDANHCPGSVMFLFKLTSGKVILHVGDFRHHLNMESISAFWNRSIDVLYLDTTYLDPCYDFLSQDAILEKCENIAEEHTKFTKNTFFVVGSYTIGKEKVFKSIASKLDCKIYAEPYKERILRCLEDPEIDNRLTNNKIKAQVHVISMRNMSLCKLKKYMEEMQNSFKVLVAIKPTGWEHNSDTECNLTDLKPKQIGNIYLYGLPYSEHSSFSELRRFYQFIQPNKTIPTVCNSKQARLKMEGYFEKWKRQCLSTFSKS